MVFSMQAFCAGRGHFLHCKAAEAQRKTEMFLTEMTEQSKKPGTQDVFQAHLY